MVQGDGGVPDHQVPHTPGSLRRPCLGLQLRSSQKGSEKAIFSIAEFINLTAVLYERVGFRHISLATLSLKFSLPTLAP